MRFDTVYSRKKSLRHSIIIKLSHSLAELKLEVRLIIKKRYLDNFPGQYKGAG